MSQIMTAGMSRSPGVLVLCLRQIQCLKNLKGQSCARNVTWFICKHRTHTSSEEPGPLTDGHEEESKTEQPNEPKLKFGIHGSMTGTGLGKPGKYKYGKTNKRHLSPMARLENMLPKDYEIVNQENENDISSTEQPLSKEENCETLSDTSSISKQGKCENLTRDKGKIIDRKMHRLKVVPSQRLSELIPEDYWKREGSEETTEHKNMKDFSQDNTNR